MCCWMGRDAHKRRKLGEPRAKRRRRRRRGGRRKREKMKRGKRVGGIRGSWPRAIMRVERVTRVRKRPRDVRDRLDWSKKAYRLPC